MRPEGKIRTDYFSFNATRPPPKEGRNSGGVSLLFRKGAGASQIFKHSEKELPNYYTPVGAFQDRAGVLIASIKQSRDRKVPQYDKYTC